MISYRIKRNLKNNIMKIMHSKRVSYFAVIVFSILSLVITSGVFLTEPSLVNAVTTQPSSNPCPAGSNYDEIVIARKYFVYDQVISVFKRGDHGTSWHYERFGDKEADGNNDQERHNRKPHELPKRLPFCFCRFHLQHNNIKNHWQYEMICCLILN